ncbi:MAG: hypothetical protein IJQ24_00795 [Synergistaceae bacterium]|nr:hypothetical protein [Synergistaceae bacterium]
MRRIVLALMMSIYILTSAEGVTWQKHVSFPDWKGYTDDTLAMNSMVSFNFWHGQGNIYFKTSGGAKSFRAFVNNKSIDTSSSECDISGATVDGINTLQVSNIEPCGNVEVFIPYPVVISGSFEDEGIRPESLELIEDIISSDIAHGFSSAQLAIIRNGRFSIL